MPLNDFFRLQNIFNNQSSNNVSWPSFGDSNRQNNLVPDETIEVQAEDETPAQSAFLQSIMSQPERTKPSLLRVLGTGLLSALQGSTDDEREKIYDQQGKVIGTKRQGFWGSLGNKPLNVDQASSVLNAPYEQKLSDWKTRTGTLKEAANIESQLPGRRALAEQRMAQANVIPQRESRMLREGESRINRNEALTEQGSQRIEIARAKQGLDEWKAKNPQGKVYAPKGGNVILINPITGEPTDTGIPTGTLSDEERIRLTGQERLQQIGATGVEQRRTQSMRDQNELGQIAARGEESRKTKETIPGKAASVLGISGKELSPSQQKVQYQLKANQAVQEHPEWNNFISVDDDGMVDIQPPTKTWYGGTKGPDKATYDAMVQYISGKSQAAKTQAAPVKSANVTTKPTSATVIVQDKNGKKYNLPTNQLQDAIKQGYTQVK